MLRTIHMTQQQKDEVCSFSNVCSGKRHKFIFPLLIFLNAFEEIAQIIEVYGRIFRLCQKNLQQLVKKYDFPDSFFYTKWFVPEQ